MDTGAIGVVEDGGSVCRVVHHDLVFQPGADGDGAPAGGRGGISHNDRLPSERVAVGDGSGAVRRRA